MALCYKQNRNNRKKKNHTHIKYRRRRWVVFNVYCLFFLYRLYLCDYGPIANLFSPCVCAALFVPRTTVQTYVFCRRFDFTRKFVFYAIPVDSTPNKLPLFVGFDFISIQLTILFPIWMFVYDLLCIVWVWKLSALLSRNTLQLCVCVCSFASIVFIWLWCFSLLLRGFYSRCRIERLFFGHLKVQCERLATSSPMQYA